MADRPPPDDTGNEIDTEPAPVSTSGTPRWVKVVGVGILVVAVLVVFVLLTGGPGAHGPSLHN